MDTVATSLSNPFGMDPDCEPFVPGYGDANADVHVIGDHPGIHGGLESGIPFTGSESGDRLRGVLARVGLLGSTGVPPPVERTYLSYLYPCGTDGDPSPAEYARLEPVFDAELRAITAHVLVPVGARATRHVARIATTVRPEDVDLDRLHATEISGSGWLVVPVKDPATWTGPDEEALVAGLEALLARDFRREADLGRFLPGGDAYLVR